MANYKFDLQRSNGSTYDDLYPKTIIEQVVGLQAVLDAKYDDGDRGVANGIASLDATGKIPGTQIPAWLMTGGQFFAGTISSSINLSTFITTLNNGLATGQSVTSRYGWFLSVLSNGSISWADNTPAGVYYYITPSDENDQTSPVNLEIGDLVVFTEFIPDTPSVGNNTYRFSVINGSRQQATTSEYGNVLLSDETVFSALAGNGVITESVLKTVITNANFQPAGSYQPLDTDLTAIAGLSMADGNFIVGNGTTWTVESDATARASLGLTIGTHVQAFDATLASLSLLGTGADKMLYSTGIDTWAELASTAFGRGILNWADASAGRTALGLVIGTNVQAYDADLARIAGFTHTDGNIMVSDGTQWVLESGSVARASLGLTIGTHVQAYSANLANIDGLAKTANYFMIGDGTNWTSKSPADARTAMAVYSSAQVDALLTNRPEIFYNTTTGAGLGDLIIANVTAVA